MNDKDILLDKNSEQEAVARISHRKVLGGALAAVICLLLAALIWVCIMNTTDTDYIPIRVVAPTDYAVALSVDGVEVEGTVSTLKGMKEIVITLTPEDVEYILGYYEGVAAVNQAVLQLSPDVSVADDWSAVLTVTPKQ